MKYPTALISLSTILILAPLHGASAEAPPWRWAEHHAGATAGITESRIAVDAAGNSYVTGTFSGAAEFGSFSLTSSGGNDIYLAKMNPNGEVLWARSAGGSGADAGRGVAVDDSGNVYVTGSFQGSASFGSVSVAGSSSQNVFLAKYNSAGQVQWVRAGGGSGTDNSFSVAVDAGGNPYITGLFTATAQFGSLPPLVSAGNSDIFVVAYTSSGDEQWAVRAGGFASESQAEAGRTIAVDAAGDVFIAGHFVGTAHFGSHSVATAGGYDVFVAKYSPAAGAWQWAVRGGGSGEDFATELRLASDGSIYVAGRFSGTANFGGTTVVAGSGGFGERGRFVSKYDSAGTLQWILPVDGIGLSEALGIDVDAEDNLYLGGSFQGSITIGETALVSAGNDNAFVAKFSPEGESEWAVHSAGDFFNVITGVAVDSFGGVHVTGWFSGSAEFGDIVLTTSAIDSFVAKMGLERDEQNEDPLFVILDIRPGSCTNPLQVKSRGVLPVAILGVGDYDVTEIDLTTIGLWRADGVGGSVAPLESPGIKFEDVGTCAVEKNGTLDLTMKFSVTELVEILELNGLPRGTEVELLISGALADGREFAGIDYVVIR